MTKYQGSRTSQGPTLAILGLALLPLVSSAAPDEKIEWLTEYKSGVEAAQAAKKPLLLYFWAEW